MPVFPRLAIQKVHKRVGVFLGELALGYHRVSEIAVGHHLGFGQAGLAMRDGKINLPFIHAFAFGNFSNGDTMLEHQVAIFMQPLAHLPVLRALGLAVGKIRKLRIARI